MWLIRQMNEPWMDRIFSYLVKVNLAYNFSSKEELPRKKLDREAKKKERPAEALPTFIEDDLIESE